MLQNDPAILTASRTALRVLTVLNLTFAIIFIIMLGLSFPLEERILSFLARNDGVAVAASNLSALRAALVIGLTAAPLGHLILTRLHAIVATVGSGDAFTPLNAVRLKAIAWSLLGLQILDLLFGVVALSVDGSDAPLSGWSFNITGWIAVLLLFVLARVFQQGTRLRDDLEGTV